MNTASSALLYLPHNSEHSPKHTVPFVLYTSQTHTKNNLNTCFGLFKCWTFRFTATSECMPSNRAFLSSCRDTVGHFPIFLHLFKLVPGRQDQMLRRPSSYNPPLNQLKLMQVECLSNSESGLKCYCQLLKATDLEEIRSSDKKNPVPLVPSC